MKYNQANKEKLLFRGRKAPAPPKANLLSDPYEVLIANQCVKAALEILDPPGHKPPKIYPVNLALGKSKYTQWKDS